jgi:hypothetical protein
VEQANKAPILEACKLCLFGENWKDWTHQKCYTIRAFSSYPLITSREVVVNRAGSVVQIVTRFSVGINFIS